MAKLLWLIVVLVSLILKVKCEFLTSPFLVELEEAVKSVDPEAFEAAYSSFPSMEKDLTGHHLWTLYMENWRIKYGLFFSGDLFAYPENYAEKRTKLLNLLFDNELVSTDSKARGRHTLQAVMENDIEALDLLLQNGYPLNVCDEYFNTPLCWAICSGFFRCARTILMYGGYEVLLFTRNQEIDLLQALLEAPQTAEESHDRELVAQYLRDQGFGYEEAKACDSE